MAHTLPFCVGIFDHNVDSPDSDLYLIGSQLEDYRADDGFFYFTMCWPDKDLCIFFKQRNSPFENTKR